MNRLLICLLTLVMAVPVTACVPGGRPPAALPGTVPAGESAPGPASRAEGPSNGPGLSESEEGSTVGVFNLESKTVTLNSGCAMPLNGLGTYSLHGSECVNAVKSAIERGVRLIDTARMYGNEEEIGRAIREEIAAGAVTREDLFVTTNYVQYWGASACPSVAANRCNSTSSIFNSPTTPVDAGGVCNTFATVNRGLKINFQGANTPYPGRGINPPRGRFWESDSFLASGCPP